MTYPLNDTVPPSAKPRKKVLRSSVLLHPAQVSGGTFLALPHPRSLVPTYYLSVPTANTNTTATAEGSSNSPNTAVLLELSSLTDTKLDRSWFISSNVNQIISKAQLEILSPVDIKFLIISILLVGCGDGKFRSIEDAFEEAAQTLFRRRKEDMIAQIPELKDELKEAGAAGDMDQMMGEEWTDILTFGSLPTTRHAMGEVADVQQLPNGEETFRLSQTKIYNLLDRKLSALASRKAFVTSPNVLARSFERRWKSDSDPSIYVSQDPDSETQNDCSEAQQLRTQIAAEIIASYLPPQLANDWFSHLQLPSNSD